jgi:hypothetical protein
MSKRVIVINDENSLSIKKVNGDLIQKYKIEEIFGIVFSPATFSHEGSLAFATNYEEALLDSYSSINLMQDSLITTKSDGSKVSQLLHWYEENKIISNSISPYELEATAGGAFIGIKDKVVIIRNSGWLTSIGSGKTQGQKTIPIKSISSIQFRAGSDEKEGSIKLDAAGDESTISFHKSRTLEFEKIKERINFLMENLNNSKSLQISEADELAKFAKLRDEGIITEDEFLRKKGQILGL